MILRMHAYFYAMNDKVPGTLRHKNFVMWVVCNTMVRVCRVLLLCHASVCRMLGMYPQPLSGEGDVVVSFTSFPKRIGSVWLVVDSMMRQDVPPAQVQLYLSEEEFPEGRSSLPKRLLKYTELGLDIRFRPDNLMPHNKYFYALQENKDKLVVTVDDDLYYYPNTISNLLKMHEQHPDCVCSNTMKIIRYEGGSVLPYARWERPIEQVPVSKLNIALGFNGALYPTALFEHADRMFDKEAIRELSLKADDLWLKALETVYGIDVTNGDYSPSSVSIVGSQAVSLMSTNTGENAQNDVQWARLEERYGLREKLGVDKVN